MCVFNEVSLEKIGSSGKSAHEHTLHVRGTTLNRVASVYNAINFHTTTSSHSASDYRTKFDTRASDWVSDLVSFV